MPRRAKQVRALDQLIECYRKWRFVFADYLDLWSALADAAPTCASSTPWTGCT